jgi:hypothetical protein
MKGKCFCFARKEKHLPREEKREELKFSLPSPKRE